MVSAELLNLSFLFLIREFFIPIPSSVISSPLNLLKQRTNPSSSPRTCTSEVLLFFYFVLFFFPFGLVGEFFGSKSKIHLSFEISIRWEVRVGMHLVGLSLGKLKKLQENGTTMCY